MPIIPLLQQQRPTSDAAAPVLDRERRPTVDTGEVQAGLRRVNEANKMPLMDPQAMAAPFEALGSVGKALQQTGNMLGALAIKRKEAETDIQVAEADERMSRELADFEAWKQGRKPEEWMPEWQARTTRVQQELFKNEKLNEGARQQIEMRSNRWAGQSSILVARDATKETFAMAKSYNLGGIMAATEAQDEQKFTERLTEGAAKGYLFPHEVQQWRLRFEEVRVAKANDQAENKFKTAVMMRDEAAMDAALADGKARAQWDDDYITAKRIDGIKRMETLAQVEASRDEAEFLGDVLLRKADGETFTPAQVKAWATEGRVQRDTAARLMVALKSEQGAMTGELLDFLNSSVDTYNPRNDPDGLKLYELKKQAGVLGLNADQMALFEMRLKKAVDMKAPERAQKEVLVTGRKLIGEAFKDIGSKRTWDSDAEKLLADKAKLEALGIPVEKAEEISKLMTGSAPGWFSSGGKEIDKAKALTLFRQQATTRPAARPEGLTDAEWSKFTALADGDAVVDPTQAAGAEMDRAVLEEGLESWYEYERQKRGTPPTEIEVKQWIGDKTRAVLQGIGARNLFQMPTASAGQASGIDTEIIDMVKQFEGFNPNSYPDNKQISIGYGTRAKFDGETITEQEAIARLSEELTSHSKRVDSLVASYGVTLTPEQRKALISFDYNTGAANRLFERAGTDVSKFGAIMREFKYSDGKVLPGLVKRREQEAKFFE